MPRRPPPARLLARAALVAAVGAAALAPRSAAAQVEPRPAPPVWTTEPIRIDPDVPRRERLPPRAPIRDPRRMLRVDAFPQVAADASFAAGGLRWRLAHVMLPPRDRLCHATDGRAWPCGVHAWARLQGALVNARLWCSPPVADGGSFPAVACDLQGRPLAETLIDAGWLLPTADAPPRLREIARRAETARRGLWATEVPDPSSPQP